jgi:hypothetical protein
MLTCSLLHADFLLGFLSSILKIEAIFSYEMSVDLQKTTRLYIAELYSVSFLLVSFNDTLQSHEILRFLGTIGPILCTHA